MVRLDMAGAKRNQGRENSPRESMMDPPLQMSLLHFQDQLTSFPDCSWSDQLSSSSSLNSQVIPSLSLAFASQDNRTFQFYIQLITLIDMGNCVPVQKSTEPAMQLKSSIISQEKGLRIESPIKDNKVKVDLSMAEFDSKLKSSSPTPYGLSNQDEMFFDSQPWIDSDIEDFLSVNGGFTPLGGATPLHQDSFINNPQVNESVYISSNVNSPPESSPTDMKKQLIEYFRESFSSDADDHQDSPDKSETKPVALYLPSKCRNGNSYEAINNSICSTETTPNGYFNPSKGKPAQSESQCCFPNLVRSFSFSERKKRLSNEHKLSKSCT